MASRKRDQQSGEGGSSDQHQGASTSPTGNSATSTKRTSLDFGSFHLKRPTNIFFTCPRCVYRTELQHWLYHKTEQKWFLHLDKFHRCGTGKTRRCSQQVLPTYAKNWPTMSNDTAKRLIRSGLILKHEIAPPPEPFILPLRCNHESNKQEQEQENNIQQFARPNPASVPFFLARKRSSVPEMKMTDSQATLPLLHPGQAMNRRHFSEGDVRHGSLTNTQPRSSYASGPNKKHMLYKSAGATSSSPAAAAAVKFLERDSFDALLDRVDFSPFEQERRMPNTHGRLHPTSRGSHHNDDDYHLKMFLEQVEKLSPPKDL